MAQLGPPGDAVNWLLRNASIGAMALGLVAAARDEGQRCPAVVAFCLGALALGVWAVTRVLQKNILGG